ncbi:MAG: cytochrome C554 and C-prime [Chlorobi bacterium]|nr:cytochrome C554 and C-prime [Chlorobiota bacterium]
MRQVLGLFRKKTNKGFRSSFILFGLMVLTVASCNSPADKVHPLTKTWEKAIPNQEVPEGLTSLSSVECGSCHQNHYAEWKLSTHAHAWTDLQFQAERKKDSSPLMCINCHIPLQNQQEYIVTGLIDGDIYRPVKTKNPKFDKKLQQEGITCASCHVRGNSVIGPSGRNKAPHKTIIDPDFLSERLCISCHNANAVITPVLACTFETGDEWKSGPYFGKKNCITCHMDTVRREIVPGFGERLSHFHYFPGSGIPKLDTLETKVLNGLAFYPSSPKEAYLVNEEITYKLKVKNEFAGHKVPTGDPERFFIISFELKDVHGNVLSEKTERIGEIWQWHPVARKLSDNNLAPMEEREFVFSYIPENREKLTLFVKVTKNRMDKKTADYNKLGANYPLFITIFNSEYKMEVR